MYKSCTWANVLPLVGFGKAKQIISWSWHTLQAVGDNNYEQKVGWHDGCGLGVLYDLAPRAVRTENWSYHDDRFTGFDWKPFKHKRCSLERELSFSPVLTHELPFNFSQPSRMLQATACSSRLLECWRDVHSSFGNVTHVDLSGGGGSSFQWSVVASTHVPSNSDIPLMNIQTSS